MTDKNSHYKILYPWIVWALAASFFYYKYLIQVSPGVMSSELMRDFSLTGAGLGNLAACFFYCYLLMQIPVGILLDKWSPGKITAMAVGVCASGIYFFANSQTLFTAGLSRFLIGLSAAFAAVSCFKLASIWFPPKRFAFVAGLSMTIAMMGAVGGEGPLSVLVTKFGWRQALELIAIPGFVLSLLIWFVIKDKSASTYNENKLVINKNPIKLSTQFTIILKDKQTWILSLYSGLAFAPVSVFGGLWGVSFIQKSYGLSLAEAANLISLIFIGFAIGCPITGWFSDYIGQRKPIMIAGTVMALMSIVAVLYFPIPKAYVSLGLFLFGIGASSFFLCFAMVRELHSLILTGTVLGFMNTFDSICEAVTEPFIGKLLDLHWAGIYENGARVFSISDYHLSLLALPVYLGIALILLVFIEETYCGQKVSVQGDFTKV
jgi:sugar phosphate permease